MRIISCLASLSFISSIAGSYYKNSKVTEVSSKDFNSFVLGSKRAVFVKFYSPHCGHCKDLIGIWNSLAADIGAHVDIAAVNCQEAGDICRLYRIEGVPSLKIFTKDDMDDKRLVLDYNGERKLAPLVDFAKRHAVSYVYIIDTQVKTPSPKRHVVLSDFFSKGPELPKAILFKRNIALKMPFKTLSSKFFTKTVIGAVSLPGNESLFAKYSLPEDKDTLILFPPGKTELADAIVYKDEMAFTPISQFLQKVLDKTSTKPKEDL